MSIPRGFRDLDPEVARTKSRVIERLVRIYELYGFAPLETPSIEYWETLAGKYGEEAESKLIWRFTDPLSKREYALRYDLTVPLARYVSSHPELPLPFKRYQIGAVWRHEEPQRMRYREFTQADVDIVGSPYIEADAEIVNVTLHALSEAGVSDAIVRINDRRLTIYVFRKVLQIDELRPVLRAIDKLDRVGTEGVREELLRLGMSESVVHRLLDIIQIRGRWDEVAEELRSLVGQGGENLTNQVSSLFSLLREESRALFDLSMVRGLDYYTGPIFEFGLRDVNAPSIGGGGRYDGLIRHISGKTDMPATGASIGVDRVVDILMKGEKTKEEKNRTKIYVVCLSPELYKEAWRIAYFLRESGISAEVDLMRRSEAKQRKNAYAIGATHLLFVGEKEVTTSTYTLYEIDTGRRFESGLNEIILLLREKRQDI